MNVPLQVVVAHKGAREHFLAARALHRNGQLAALVTDWYSPVSARCTGRLGAAVPWVARALGAVSAELPRSRVIALNGFGIRSRLRLRGAEKAGRLLEEMAADDAAFARRVARLKLPPHDVFFGFSYASLETLQAERVRGSAGVLDQIDPGRLEWDIIREEAERWPAYAEPMGEPPPGYYERAEQEWREADLVVVNSAWTRDALVRRGADPHRIEVVPLAYEHAVSMEPCVPREGPLTILWLGSVILRKGIQYLIEAAKALANERVQFVIAGPMGVRPDVFRDLPANIRYVGAVPRSEAARIYSNADVFVLPTLSDGFAITQIEALAHGLPVIATPNCGAVVEEGRTGFLVPPRDAGALANAIRRFICDPKLAPSMRENCRTAASTYSVAAYARRLNDALARAVSLRAGRSARPV